MPAVTVQHDGNSAWVFADGAMIHTRADDSSTRAPYRIALAKRGGAWRWRLFSGSVPRGY